MRRCGLDLNINLQIEKNNNFNAFNDRTINIRNFNLFIEE